MTIHRKKLHWWHIDLRRRYLLETSNIVFKKIFKKIPYKLHQLHIAKWTQLDLIVKQYIEKIKLRTFRSDRVEILVEGPTNFEDVISVGNLGITGTTSICLRNAP